MEQAKKGRCPPTGASRRKHRAAYPWEFRRKAVTLYLEEGSPPKLICRELGIHESVLYAWVRRFREGGEAGLKPRARGGGSRRRPGEVLQQKIADVKGRHPSFGVKRISQWLKRVLFLPACRPSTCPFAGRPTRQSRIQLSTARSMRLPPPWMYGRCQNALAKAGFAMYASG
jgi:transposase-like protein